MSQGYSMKHIGITIVVSLIVVVLISPLLRPKGESLAGSAAEATPEVRAAVEAYRDTMTGVLHDSEVKFKAGTGSMAELLLAQLACDLARLEFFALDAPGGNGAARAVVKIYYLGKLRTLAQTPGALEDTTRIRITQEECLARIELAGKETELSGNEAFAEARAEWERNPAPENLKRMFEAELK